VCTSLFGVLRARVSQRNKNMTDTAKSRNNALVCQDTTKIFEGLVCVFLQCIKSAM
jgi:hypothetical protein